MAEIRSREFWERHVAACEASGEKRAAYCRRQGLNYWTFNDWRRRLQSTASGSTSPRQALVPVMVRTAVPVESAGLELRVGAQVTLSLPMTIDAVWLGTVLREASSC